MGPPGTGAPAARPPGVRLRLRGAWAVLALVAVALAYLGAARASLLLAVEGTPASPVWPPSGIALAAVLLLGRRALGPVFAGALFANAWSLLAGGAEPARALAVSAAISSGSTIEAALGGWLLRRATGGRDPFASSGGLLRFVGVALVVTVPAALVGPSAAVLGGVVPVALFGTMAATWWLGDTAGVILVAPLLVLLASWRPGPLTLRRLSEFTAVGALAAVALVTLPRVLAPYTTGSPPLGWLVLPFVVWGGFRFGRVGAAAVALLIAAVGVAATADGGGPFTAVTDNARLLFVQASTMTAMITTLAIAVSVEERRGADAAARRARDELEGQVRAQTAQLAEANDALRGEVAERRQTQAALARHARELQHALSRQNATLEATADGILVVDSEGRISSFNRRFQEMWRIPDEVVASRDDEAALAYVIDQLEDPDNFLAKVRGLYADPDAESYDELVFTDGRVFERYSRPQKLAGHSVGRVWSFRDVTEQRHARDELRKRAEDLAESNADLERFAYVASHDLREPLRTVTMYVQLLDRRYGETLDGDARDFIRLATGAARRMDRLIQDLLTYSRVERAQVAPESTDAGAVLADVLTSMAPVLEADNAVVTHDTLPWVMADRTQLGQVLQNLVANAVKFHRPGVPARVHISGHATGEEVEIAVTDNGVGIEPDYRRKVFVLFQRLDPKYPGTGVGLAICKKIVERHGGRIWVESAPGKGSTFHFTLHPAHALTRSSAGTDGRARA